MSSRKNADRDLKEVLGNWGLAFEILRVLINAILAVGGKIEHLKRLLNEPKLVEQIARLLVPIESAVAAITITVSDAIEVMVDYVHPVLKSLKEWFPGYLHPAFQNDIAFEAIEPYVAVERVAGKKKFVLVHLGRNVSNEEVLSELDRLGLRPAFYVELYAYSRANSTAGLEFPVVALGDTALVVGSRLVAYLDRRGDERALRLSWVVNDWRGHCRFLAVRK